MAQLDDEIALLQAERRRKNTDGAGVDGPRPVGSYTNGQGSGASSLGVDATSAGPVVKRNGGSDLATRQETFGQLRSSQPNESPLDVYTAPRDLRYELLDGDDVDPFAQHLAKKEIASREDDYKKRRFDRADVGTRFDPLTAGENGTDSGTTYAQTMKMAELEREEARINRLIREKGLEEVAAGATSSTSPAPEAPRRKRRWDVTEKEVETAQPEAKSAPVPDLTSLPEKPRKSRWDKGPEQTTAQNVSSLPTAPVSSLPTAPVPAKKSRWDQTPTASAMPMIPLPAPPVNGLPIVMNWQGANRPLSDEELDELIPTEGYKILTPPAGYAAPRKGPTSQQLASSGFVMPNSSVNGMAGMKDLGQELPKEIPGVGQLAYFKQQDMQYFGKLLDTKEDDEYTMEELKDRKIMRLLLKVKNGDPRMRKTALRQLADRAREFGAGPLFDRILPLLMERTLEDQERHLLVKIIDRVLFKLDDLVRPYVHKILVVIEPLLIDEDYFARVEGREIISNLSKAAGLAHMISTMRPDIDHADEYVRNTTARAFSVVASALGIPALLPFLRAVCKSKKSWQARHTGIKIIQQIAILMGSAVLPHLTNLVECVGAGLDDDQQKVRTMTALALAALAEAAAPYGIESFESVLKPLHNGIRKYRGKGLAAFLKAIGYIIPLMDPEWASIYCKEVMKVLKREFESPDEEMKKIVLKVVKQISATEGIQPGYLRTEILDDFFKYFWVRRMALDRRNYKQVIETTVEITRKVGVGDILHRIVNDLKDESEPYRKMVMETIDNVISEMGAADVDDRLEVQLIDGIIYAFQEQTVEDPIMLNGFGTVVNALGMRAKPYLVEIASAILWRMNNKSAQVRQQSADLIARIAIVMKKCDEEPLLGKLGLVLYEHLGEEYPEVLGSILGALRAIVSVVGTTSMQPPIKDLLPRLTPIMRNRHEKVQENTVDLVGRIADRGAEFVAAREWMRICFELLDMLKAHKKGIRRAAVNTFGYIAKAIGPQDVLSVLLSNLRVQERSSRVSSTVAIAIVAETCAPFTVLPALMNEYRMEELNLRTGVLKSLSFLFEYIGEMGKDYVYAVTPLIEDALLDRDHVHRQTAAAVIKHLALGCVGLGREDAMIHLLNIAMPNVLETSAHVINNVIDAIEALGVALGPGIILSYILQGLFHPARRMREVYWSRLYNGLYVRCADSLVPFYPKIDQADDGQSSYRRDDLYLWL